MVNNFGGDLSYGQEAERRFAKLLTSKGYVIEHIADGVFPDWDIMVQGGKTFEVKADRKSEETGNFFIETTYRGNPSGLAATKAYYFTIISRGFSHTAKTEDVIRFLLSNPAKWKFIYGSGDDGNSVGILIKESLYKPKNMQVFELPPL